jgi:hypothetical protein
VSLVLFGENGDSGELHLKKSETHMNKFERNQTDVFVFDNILSLGELTKCRIWHDNSGTLIGNSHWHLNHVLIEDVESKRNYRFECNKWLSISKDDKQIVRELVCTTNERGRTTPKAGVKTDYEINVLTSDRRDAGTTQNAWIVLIGSSRESKQFLMENSVENKILRRSILNGSVGSWLGVTSERIFLSYRGQNDQFLFNTKSVGDIKSIVLGHYERDDMPLKSKNGREGAWFCEEVRIKDNVTDMVYECFFSLWKSVF